MTELEFRNKVTWFSFALSLLVIWVHSYNAELFLGYQAATGMVYVLEHRIGDWFGQIAVPGFFMISGYRFYRDFDWGKLRGKWQRRIKSLLVPYIVWNFLYYLSYVIASRIPAVGDVVGKGVVEFSLTAVVDAVVAHTYNNVFWYLYQLLWLVLLAPVLYPLLKRVWSGLLLLLFFWILVQVKPDGFPVNPDAMIYYGSGAMLAHLKDRRITVACHDLKTGKVFFRNEKRDQGRIISGDIVATAGLQLPFLPLIQAGAAGLL